MTNIFDDGFDSQDAAIIGGIMGFAEEAMREENRELEDVELEELLLDSPPDRDASLAAFRKSNPELYRRIIHIIATQRVRWAQSNQHMRDMESVKDEILAMEKCEAMLNGGGNK